MVKYLDVAFPWLVALAVIAVLVFGGCSTTTSADVRCTGMGLSGMTQFGFMNLGYIDCHYQREAKPKEEASRP